jgi:manganese-dependent ADP-ribose/CDP-alcohol diphosphatase
MLRAALFLLCIVLVLPPMAFAPPPQASPPSPPSSPPLFQVGLITDIQYADIPDGASFSGVPRYYRSALSSLTSAMERFRSAGVSFVINLGDSIDGQCLPTSIPAVTSILSGSGLPVNSVYGNHELYVLSREDIGVSFGVPMFVEDAHTGGTGGTGGTSGDDTGELVGYYTKRTNGWKFIFLDNYDLSVMGRSPTSAKYASSHSILSSSNPNYVAGDINSPIGLDGVDRRFVAFNGGIGDTQLRWLRDELSASRASNEFVVLNSHQPFHEQGTNPMCLPWNYDVLMEVCGEYSDVIKATFSGHTHTGGYHRDPTTGVHHVVFDAILESRDGVHTNSVLNFHDDRIIVHGSGDQRSMELLFYNNGVAKNYKEGNEL